MPPLTPHGLLLSPLPSPCPAMTIISISHFNEQLPSQAALSAENWQSTQTRQFPALEGACKAVGNVLLLRVATWGDVGASEP